MNRVDAKQQIRERATDYLQPDNCNKGYLCPICGSGSGRNGTGITTKDGIHFTCWAGCFTNADIIDIIGLQHGLTDYNGKLQAAAREFNISIDGNQETRGKQHSDNVLYIKRASQPESEADYTEFFLQAALNIGRTSYHRGLTAETLERFRVGYVEDWRHPKAPMAPSSPRLIIPTSPHSYLARDTRSELTDEQRKYSKSKVGRVRIFNSRALMESKQPIFVVEGEIDALSIIDVGGEAIALGSAGNRQALITLLEGSPKPSQPLIIALDNDEAGKKASQELITQLQRLQVPAYGLDVAYPYKDTNEALNADRGALKAAVAHAMARALTYEAEALNLERTKLKQESAAFALPDFLKNIEDSKQAAFTPTGFSSLDGILDGGLYAGLYVVGAISSLGKTTFCLQIADAVAQAGRDVLLFSLEMAQDELMAKSISRLTVMEDIAQHGSTAHAKTTRGILTGAKYRNYSHTEYELIQDAIATYRQYAQHIYITEGMGNVGVAQIRGKVKEHIRVTGKAPVVVIDYLQIIAPADMRATDKQNTDRAILELKRLSRDYAVPVIGISSFNRDNYKAPVNLASFKESGAIEYSSDVLIGLQYEGMDYREGETDASREKRIRELLSETIEDVKNGHAQKIQVKVLKNRNGSKGGTVLDFYPMFNYFCEGNDQEDGGDDKWRKSIGGYKMV